MKWISVEYDLPNEESFVLALQADGYISQAEYNTEIHGSYNGFSDDSVTEAVTHWMPLPEPPSE